MAPWRVSLHVLMKEKNLIHKEQQTGLQVYSRTGGPWSGAMKSMQTPGKLWEGRGNVEIRAERFWSNFSWFSLGKCHRSAAEVQQ